jgi:hypothetical protein
MGALDELLSAWRNNPDADATIALSGHLAHSSQEDLIREVGASAQQWHETDAEVMLAVGRMYLQAAMLGEAQASLVAAGKADGRDPRPFRYLGEVLLRRGDAMRGEKVLARALQLGQGDSDTRLWHDRAVVYVTMQERNGAQVVAAEVARTLPLSKGPTVALPDRSFSSEEDHTAPRMAAVAAAASAPLPPMPQFQGRLQPPAPPHIQRAAIPALSPRTQLGGLQPPADLSYGRGSPVSVPSQRGAALGEAAHALPSFDDSEPTIMAPRSQFGIEEPRFDDRPNPDPALVLEHLARVGIYEPGGGAAPAWERATTQKIRGAWVLVLGTALLIGVGTGAWAYARHVKEQRHETAARLTGEAAALLKTGKLGDLRSSDDKLSEVFELDSLSAPAAKLWLQNRVLSELLTPSETSGIDAAVHRARSVGVPDHEVAFGRIAAFLAEGDLAGAAALLPKWDKLAGNDAFFQLAAGAALERAGDARAIERYEAARGLDQQLVATHILLTRLVLLELGAEKGEPLLAALKQTMGDTPVTRVLSALAWAVDPRRSQELPDGAHIEQDQVAKLPAPLRPVPQLVEALQAIDTGEPKRAARAIDKGIQLSQSPAMATRFGFLAIQAGDETLARKATLHALKFAAVYPQTRVLAARVALLGGRFEEAKKAIEELDPSGVDVAVVRAIIAYETLDTSELASIVDGLSDARESAMLSALAAGPGVLRGRGYPAAEKLEEIARPQIAWGEIVAADTALDRGKLELADRIMAGWNDLDRPAYRLRYARLRRYQKNADEAVVASAAAFSGVATAQALIERVYDLVAAEDHKGARELLAKYPTLLGPMTDWLRVIVDAAGSRQADAKVKAGQLELPPQEAPLVLRLLVARGLWTSGDKRARIYVKFLKTEHPRHPELGLL